MKPFRVLITEWNGAIRFPEPGRENGDQHPVAEHDRVRETNGRYWHPNKTDIETLVDADYERC